MDLDPRTLALYGYMGLERLDALAARIDAVAAERVLFRPTFHDNWCVTVAYSETGAQVEVVVAPEGASARAMEDAGFSMGETVPVPESPAPVAAFFQRSRTAELEALLAATAMQEFVPEEEVSYRDGISVAVERVGPSGYFTAEVICPDDERTPGIVAALDAFMDLARECVVLPEHLELVKQTARYLHAVSPR